MALLFFVIVYSMPVWIAYKIIKAAVRDGIVEGHQKLAEIETAKPEAAAISAEQSRCDENSIASRFGRFCRKILF